MNETTETSARIISPQRRKLIHFGMLAGAMGAVSVVAGSPSKVLACQTRNPKADIELINGAIVTTSDISGGAFTGSQTGGRGVQFSDLTVQA